MVQTLGVNVKEDLQRLRYRLIELREKTADLALTEEAPNRDSSARDFNLKIGDLLRELLTEKDQNETLEQVRQIAKQVGKTVQGDAYTLDIAISEINEVRQKLWGNNEKLIHELEISIGATLYFFKVYNLLFDEFTYSFSMAYIRTYEHNLQKSEKEFLTLSAPVVPILDGVAVLPVVGSINEQRAELLMQKALEDAAENELDRMFIDLTAVTLIDTNVAYHIINIVRALEIVGVSVCLIGIRPEAAQTMVSLGIDFSKVKTYHSLQQALKIQDIF